MTDALTKEELAELAELENADKARKEAEAVAAKRQHLEAMRLAKRLSAKHGTPGRDFVVLETTFGNIAVRRPIDVEVDELEAADGDRAGLEKFAASVTIEPSPSDVQSFMTQNPGVTGAIIRHSTALLKVVREEEAKK